MNQALRPGWQARQRGMTLVELLVGLAITALLLTSMTAMLRSAQAASEVTAAQLELQAQAQFALQRIAIQVGQTPNALLPAKSDDRNSLPWALNAGYTWDSKALTLSETIGTGTSTSTRVLADNVTSFAITSPQIATGQTLITATIVVTAGAASAAASITTRMGGLL